MDDMLMELFQRATFDESRLAGGFYHPYIPLQFAGEPTRFSITAEECERFAQAVAYETFVACLKANNGHLNPLLVDEELRRRLGITIQRSAPG